MRRRENHMTPMMTELLENYIELLDEEFWQIAKYGKAKKELKRRIADCEKKIDEERNISRRGRRKWLRQTSRK